MEDVTVVVFTKNNARILKNPPDWRLMKGRPGVFVNPDLSRVQGVPPHFWAVSAGKIVPMSSYGRRKVVESHKAIGVDNRLQPNAEPPKRRLPTSGKLALAAAGGVTIIEIVRHLLG